MSGGSFMLFSSLRWKGCVFTITPPLKLALVRSDADYLAEDEGLGICVAVSSPDFAWEVAEQLASNLSLYANEDPSRLTAGALRLRDELLRRVRVEAEHKE